MKKTALSILIVLGILIIPKLSFAGKIRVQKQFNPQNTFQKKHPAERVFSKRRDFDFSSRNSGKLLVLMVDFVEDNNSQTTGNGKFVQDIGDYPVSFAAPPHDYEFYTAQLEALKYYYLAASLGFYDIDYDLYPVQEPGADFAAFTLPNEMAYYHPPNASVELMVSRFEEYFYDSFETADLNSDIDFGEYDNFMLIHAGSEWQHDVLSDTPSDIPSFFINLASGKEYVSAAGDTVYCAANVPETISQDDNYGVVNSVFAHEFGHSLGFADLYNTFNNRPAVGIYDIMDNGGSGIAVTLGLNGEDYYEIDATLPALPGVWSRLIAWEDVFRQHRILKDASELDFNNSVTLAPAEKIRTIANDIYFVKIPLSDTEYYLIENRQVDPNGDGGISFKGALPITPGGEDYRIVLYPTYPGENTPDTPTYEYDFFLSDWQDETGASFGGGLVVWHIDDNILFNEGVTDSEGNFVSNYDNNSVNIRHSHRAVKIVEADNMDDIGNPYSLYWNGTAYEPYYKYKPKFEFYPQYNRNLFTGWDELYDSEGIFAGEYHNSELSSTSLPPFQTNTANRSLFSVYDISSYAIGYGQERNMSFRFGTKLFDNLEILEGYDEINSIGSLGSLFQFPSFPIAANNKINCFSMLLGEWENLLEEDNVVPFDSEITQPIVAGTDDDFFVCSNKSLFTLNYNNSNNLAEVQYNTEITSAPVYIESYNVLCVSTEDKLYLNSTAVDFPAAECAFDGENIVAASAGSLYFIAPETLETINHYDIPGFISGISPVCYVDSLNSEFNSAFIQNDLGDIYSINGGELTKIFDLNTYTATAPSNLSLGKISDDGQVYLVFGAGDMIFAITISGTLAPGFPVFAEYKTVKPEGFPKIIEFSGEPVILIEELHSGYIAVDSNAELSPLYSGFWDKPNLTDQYYWDEESDKLFYLFADNSEILYSSYLEDIEQNPIIWNGFRNSAYSLYEGAITYSASSAKKLAAFAFPNPATKSEIRLKIKNADENIKIKIFDVAANLLHEAKITKEPNDEQDFRWDISKISSGVYFAVITSGDEVKKIPFAIEK